jgi:hypothetical protein
VQASHLFKLTNKDGYELNKKTNARNSEYAKGNSFGFTDRERTTKKPKGIYRIAVLGDSFIWGDGIPYEKTWSHKLEKSLSEKYDSIEVMSWGICGWSTLDEFNFYKNQGKDFAVDLLIVAWVDNDPDVGKIKQETVGPPEKAHPILYKISPALAQAKVNKSNNELNVLWTDALYGPKNLADYQAVLNEFHQYLVDQSTPSILVMTPSGFGDYPKGHFNAAKPLILKAGFTCLDLYPPVEKRLGHYPNSELQANSVNAHPGNLLTEEFAIEVQAYLEQNGYFKQLHLKVPNN